MQNHKSYRKFNFQDIYWLFTVLFDLCHFLSQHSYILLGRLNKYKWKDNNSSYVPILF